MAPSVASRRSANGTRCRLPTWSHSCVPGRVSSPLDVTRNYSRAVPVTLLISSLLCSIWRARCNRYFDCLISQVNYANYACELTVVTLSRWHRNRFYKTGIDCLYLLFDADMVHFLVLVSTAGIKRFNCCETFALEIWQIMSAPILAQCLRQKNGCMSSVDFIYHHNVPYIFVYQKLADDSDNTACVHSPAFCATLITSGVDHLLILGGGAKTPNLLSTPKGVFINLGIGLKFELNPR